MKITDLTNLTNNSKTDSTISPLEASNNYVIFSRKVKNQFIFTTILICIKFNGTVIIRFL